MKVIRNGFAFIIDNMNLQIMWFGDLKFEGRAKALRYVFHEYTAKRWKQM